MVLQVGVASIAAAVQRGGGSERHPGNALDDELEVIAASIEAAALPEAHVFGRISGLKLTGLYVSNLIDAILPKKDLSYAV